MCGCVGVCVYMCGCESLCSVCVSRISVCVYVCVYTHACANIDILCHTPFCFIMSSEITDVITLTHILYLD